LIAWIARGNSLFLGTNGEKQSPKFRRFFGDKNDTAYCCHAEMQAIERARATERDVLWVARFKKDGSLAVSKPCKYCMHHIKRAGIRRICYVDKSGNWIKENIKY